MKTNKLLLSLLLTVALCAVTAQAAVLLTYDFAGGISDKTPTTVASGITATNAALVGINEDSSRSGVLGLTGANSTYGNDDYVLITLDAGTDLFDFDSVGDEGSVAFRTNALNGSSGGINGVITSISLDFDPSVGNNSANIAAATWTQLGAHVYAGTSGSTSTGTDLNYDLSGLGFSNSSSLIAFRIDTARTATWNDSYVDALTVSGLTVVPEPSTFALMGLALVGAIIGIRRRK